MGQNNSKLVVGLDFGTVHSSASCILNPSEPDSKLLESDYDIKNIHDVYFGQRKSRHVRTQLAWNKAKRRWIMGDDIERAIASREILEGDQFCLIKLALDPDSSKYTQPMRQRIKSQVANLPEEAGVKTIEGLIVKFLTLFRVEVEKKLTQMLRPIVGVELPSYDYETVIAVPAAWKQDLRQSLERSARAAGLHNVRPPVFEPDAAALLAQYDKRHLGLAPAFLADLNAPVLVLDVGGGTADAVIYMVENGSLIQATFPDGTLHGSCLLNTYFHDLFVSVSGDRRKDIISSLIHRETQGRHSNTDYESLERQVEAKLKAHVEQQFETAKKDIDEHFAQDLLQPFQVEMPYINHFDPFIKLQPPYMEFKRKDIVDEVFLRMVRPIIALIERQIEVFIASYRKNGLELKHLYFVGGASSNGFIRKQIQDHFPSLSVSTRPDDSATLVSNGAILRYLRRNAIKSTSYHCSLGFAQDEVYDPEIHGHHPRPKLCRYDGDHWVKDCVNWIVNKGDDLPPGEPRKLDKGSWNTVRSKGVQQIRQYLYKSDSHAKNHVPIVNSNNDIRRIGYLDIFLSVEARTGFAKQPRRVNKAGRRRWEDWDVFEYTVRMTDYQTVTRWEFIIPRNGKLQSPDDWKDENLMVQEASLERDALVDWRNQDHSSQDVPISSHTFGRRDMSNMKVASNMADGNTETGSGASQHPILPRHDPISPPSTGWDAAINEHATEELASSSNDNPVEDRIDTDVAIMDPAPSQSSSWDARTRTVQSNRQPQKRPTQHESRGELDMEPSDSDVPLTTRRSKRLARSMPGTTTPPSRILRSSQRQAIPTFRSPYRRARRQSIPSPPLLPTPITEDEDPGERSTDSPTTSAAAKRFGEPFRPWTRE